VPRISTDVNKYIDKWYEEGYVQVTKDAARKLLATQLPEVSGLHSAHTRVSKGSIRHPNALHIQIAHEQGPEEPPLQIFLFLKYDQFLSFRSVEFLVHV
jgi:hypothetical protein